MRIRNGLQEEELRAGWKKWGQQRQAGQLIADSIGQGVKKSTVNKHLRRLGLRGQGKPVRKGQKSSMVILNFRICIADDQVCYSA